MLLRCGQLIVALLLLLNNDGSLLKSSTGAEEATSNSAAFTANGLKDEVNSVTTPSNGISDPTGNQEANYNKQNGNPVNNEERNFVAGDGNKGSGESNETESEKDGSSNEVGGSIETDALYDSYDRYSRYGSSYSYDRYNRSGSSYDDYRYNRYGPSYDYGRHKRYGSFYDYDRYGSRYNYYRYSSYDDREGKRYSWQVFLYNRYRGTYPGRFWPRQENRWDTPEEDECNFGMRTFDTPNADECNKVDPHGIPDQPGSHDQAVKFSGAEYFNFDGVNASAYDIYDERCCKGKTYPKYPNGKYSCCGSSDYDTLREVCCDETVYPQKLGYECCAERYINTDAAICCYHPESGIVAQQLPPSGQSKEARLFTQCCGTELYDTRSHVCFMVSSYENQFLNFTLVEKKFKHTGCCEGKPYDQDVENCNETSKTYSFLSGPPCVFKQAYERKKNMALRKSYYESEYYGYNFRYNDRGNYYPRRRYQNNNYQSRCGDKMYDWPDQMCCGDIYNEEENGTVKVWDKHGGPYQCCGTERYNYNTHVCCGERVIELMVDGKHHDVRCCGQQLYNPKKEWCCDGGSAVARIQYEKGDSCCGPTGLVYNSERHVCCNNRLAEIPHDSPHYSWNLRCCASNDPNKSDQLYHRYKARCCDGVVHNITDGDSYNYECCGREIYNRYTSTCCGGNILNSSCCGKKEGYDPKIQACCNGAVATKSSSHANSCCGKIPYDYQLQTCCNDPETNEWRLTYKASRYEMCCGGKPYDPDRQSCCGLSILINDTKKTLCCDQYDPETRKYTYAAVEKKANAARSRCCGLSAYDSDNEICCSDSIVADVFKNATCCGTSSYDPKSQLCCFGKVHSRSADNNAKCCGKKSYDLKKEICCRGVVLPVSDVDRAMCCYKKPEDLPKRHW